jgi:ATP/maltotriose-dependent transcriptional regulator MalT
VGSDFDACVYIHDLEDCLRQVLVEATSATVSQAVVLLVRGALARGDLTEAMQYAWAIQRLATDKPDNCDMSAAAAHVRGLISRGCAVLETAADAYSAPLARAKAREDAGYALSARGDHAGAVAILRVAYEEYEGQADADAMARVRLQLRLAQARLHHRRYRDPPEVGWKSLTDTELQIAELVSQGLSNRQVAGQVFLSAHTVAFHLHRIFQKLKIGSRAELARLVAERTFGG